MKKIAILYQVHPPPILNGIKKPMKEGGYSDSGADIAYELAKNKIKVVLPTENPNEHIDKDWVFPDTVEGIELAINKGANTLWLNTVLYKNHPVEQFFGQGLRFIGQIPSMVSKYDNKLLTNDLMRANGIPVPDTQIIEGEIADDFKLKLSYPLMVKPILGRGSQGVSLANKYQDLKKMVVALFAEKIYGNRCYVEEYLGGMEITITLMPAGTYKTQNGFQNFKEPWCLPIVERYNHIKGVAPYNGVVAVVHNSRILNTKTIDNKNLEQLKNHCIIAAKLLDIKAPIRIDCRADNSGKFYLFDINLKPNATGPSRKHRHNQDSLSLIAARKIGWNYKDLLQNIIDNSWTS